MKNVNKFLFALALGAISFGANAQADDADDAHDITTDVPEVALLDIETGGANTTISLGPTAPTEAGEPLDFSGATDNSLTLNYSSTIASGTLRSVTAAITNGTVPAGSDLKVTAAAHTGTGGGTLGSSAGQITLDGTATDVLTGIGSSYTGDGNANGHVLTYVLDAQAVANYGNIVHNNGGTNTVTVTYTITDDI